MQVFGRLTVDSVEGSKVHCTCACGTQKTHKGFRWRHAVHEQEGAA